MESHLLQMRGLKPQIISRLETPFSVASFTDAWIETEINDINEHVNLVASFTDAWIETPTKHGQSPAKPSRIFYRCVD